MKCFCMARKQCPHCKNWYDDSRVHQCPPAGASGPYTESDKFAKADGDDQRKAS